jgi:hypothetical protein
MVSFLLLVLFASCLLFFFLALLESFHFIVITNTIFLGEKMVRLTLFFAQFIPTPSHDPSQLFKVDARHLLLNLQSFRRKEAVVPAESPLGETLWFLFAFCRWFA